MNALVPFPKPDEDQADDWSFDWRSDPNIVCEEQPALAVYTNPRGQCVIRQERRWDEQEDTVILVCREYALKVAHEILSAVGMGDIEFVRPCGGGYEDVLIDTEVPARDASRPKDPTAAARQKRRRAKLKEQRDAALETTVTDRDEAESALPLRLVAAE